MATKELIPLAIDRVVFDLEGDLTKKQVKKLRKASSLYHELPEV